MEAALSAGRLSVSCPCQFSKSSYLNIMTNASFGGDWLRDLTTRSGWRPKKKAACLFGGVSWGEHMNAYGSEGDKKWRVFSDGSAGRCFFSGQGSSTIRVGDQKRSVLSVGERVWGFLFASLQVIRTSPSCPALESLNCLLQRECL